MLPRRTLRLQPSSAGIEHIFVVIASFAVAPQALAERPVRLDLHGRLVAVRREYVREVGL